MVAPRCVAGTVTCLALLTFPVGVADAATSPRDIYHTLRALPRAEQQAAFAELPVADQRRFLTELGNIRVTSYAVSRTGPPATTEYPCPVPHDCDRVPASPPKAEVRKPPPTPTPPPQPCHEIEGSIEARSSEHFGDLLLFKFNQRVNWCVWDGGYGRAYPIDPSNLRVYSWYSDVDPVFYCVTEPGPDEPPVSMPINIKHSDDMTNAAKAGAWFKSIGHCRSNVEVSVGGPPVGEVKGKIECAPWIWTHLHNDFHVDRMGNWH